MSDRFPSISPDGLQIAASALPRGGQAIQYVGNTTGQQWQPHEVEKDASGGVFQSPTRLLFARNKPGSPDDGAILLRENGRVVPYRDPGLEGWSCDNGHFVGWMRHDRVKAITVSRDGHRAGIVQIDDDTNLVEVDGVEIDRGVISEPRYTGEALVWINAVTGVRRVFGRQHHGAQTENLSVFIDDEFWPRVIDTARGRQVMTHGHPERGRPLFMRPWGKDQFRGHVVAHGITDRPDARELPNGLVLVAYSNLVALQRELVNLNAAPVDIREPIVVPPPPPVEPPKEPPLADVREVPNRVGDVAAARDRYPTEWRLCHKDYPQDGSRTTREEAERFIRLLAYDLHQDDPRWGLNGKRATDELSQDALCFRHDDGRESVVDVVLGAGGDHPSPMWDVVGRYRVAGDGQKWIRPERVVGSQPPVTPPTQPPVTPPPSRDFPSFAVPWDIFVDATIRFRGEIHDRDKLGGDSMGAGALGYFVPHFYASIIDDIKLDGLPAGSPEQVYARWAAMADRGVARGLALYHRDQGRP